VIKEDGVVRDSNGKICIVSGVNKNGITVEYNNGGHCEDSDFLEHGSYEVIEDIRSMYEQQKQRADRLEKRWEKLKEHFIKEKEQSFGILSWSRNNGMLELMEKLEEDGE